jgi:hypothetical protein
MNFNSGDVFGEPRQSVVNGVLHHVGYSISLANAAQLLHELRTGFSW